MNDIRVIEYQQQRVLTSAQLAAGYGATTNRIKNNFMENKKRYTEGKHYYCLKDDELRRFKDWVGNSDLVADRAPALYLWTEHGALLHAKSLNTDKAWQTEAMTS